MVKIDSVKDTSGDDIYWEVKHRKLLIYDSNRELITDATIGNHKLEIEYWVRISKDMMEQLNGKWIIELAELSAYKKSESQTYCVRR